MINICTLTKLRHNRLTLKRCPDKHGDGGAAHERCHRPYEYHRRSGFSARAAFLWCCSSAAFAGRDRVAAQALDPINVLVVNERSTLHYAAFAARELGFYEVEDLDVNLLASDTTVPYVAFLANGDADLVMLDAAQVFQAVNAKQPVSVVFEANQFAPESIAVMKDSAIQGLADLKGNDGRVSQATGIRSPRWSHSKPSVVGIDDISTVVVGEAGPVLAEVAPGTAPSTPIAGQRQQSRRDRGGRNPGAKHNSLRGLGESGQLIRHVGPAEGGDQRCGRPVSQGLCDGNARRRHRHEDDGGAQRKNVPEQWEDTRDRAQPSRLRGVPDQHGAHAETRRIAARLYGNESRRPSSRSAKLPVRSIRRRSSTLPISTSPATITTADVKAAIAKWKAESKDILLP